MVNINQYLNKGFIWDGEYWKTDIQMPRIENLDYEVAKNRFWMKLDDTICPIAKDKKVLWTMSSGLDTSSILTHVRLNNNNPNTVCLDNGRGDAEFSIQLADDWGFENHDVVKIDEDKIEKYLLEINSILSSPVAHTYIFFSYYLFKYAEEKGYETVVMGDGPDVSMLGTHVLHQNIIETAIKLKQYDLNAANEILQKSSYVEPTALEHTRLLCNALTKYAGKTPKYDTTYFYNTWSENEILGAVLPEWKLQENTIEHRIWAEWVQFLFRTRKPTNELLKNFNFKQVSPYLEMNNFCLSLPVEYRYCLHSTKHLMVDLYGENLPLYITYKTRTGFNPSDPWANQYKDVINDLLDKYVWDKSKEIHSYIPVDHLHNGFFTFNQKWSLINLSMWIDNYGNRNISGDEIF